ncbi:MAG TPA: NAD(P)/FAD-dependent oxidoreductase, partial [Symbiobacteriaceae bacterium]|nr:NAD(P)/FAD-dependent oxidoreductase [Symbiobacteriaceae bacterium]
GAGIAGLSTAIWSRRLNLSTLVLEQSPHEGGQLRAIAQPIIDYPGVQAASGPDLAGALRRQAADAGAVLRLGEPVTAVDLPAHSCSTPSGVVCWQALVLAAGLTARRLGVPGESELYSHGLVRRPSRDPAWFRGKRVAVVGGGDRAAENALMLASLAEQVYLIHRRAGLRARESFQEPLRQAPNVEWLLCTEVSSFRFDPLRLCLAQPERDWELPADAVCIYIGNRANASLVAGRVDLDPAGRVLVDRNGQTSAAGVYAVGDICTPPEYQSLATSAGQAMVVAKHIALSRA